MRHAENRRLRRPAGRACNTGSTRKGVRPNKLPECEDRALFPSGRAAACEKKSFHVFLLDMVMPMVGGLELGREIRRSSTDAQIICITTEPGFALDAYAVNPLHYLLKPVEKERLFAALFLNFAYCFVSGDDVEQTLTGGFVPLMLLTAVTVLMYLAMFLSLRKTLRALALREENLKIQSDREPARQRLALTPRNAAARIRRCPPQMPMEMFGRVRAVLPLRHAAAQLKTLAGTAFMPIFIWKNHALWM